MVPELWVSARMTIPGFFYLLAIFFFAFFLFKVEDLKFLEKYKSYEPYVSVAIILLSYVIGTLANSLLVATYKFLMRIYCSAKRYLSNEKTRVEQSSQDSSKLQVFLLLNASDRVLNELNGKYSYMIFFRSLMVGVPLSGIGFAFWLHLDRGYVLF